MWAKILERASTRPSVRALFEGATLEALDESRALIRLREHEQMEFGRLNADGIAEMFRLETGRRLRIAFESATEEAPSEELRAITPEVRREAESNPLVRRAMELFDARVISVENRTAPITKQDTTTEGA